MVNEDVKDSTNIGRATTSTILRRPSNSKITKRGAQATSSNMIEDIPRELLIEILCRVAQTSFTDIHNAKLRYLQRFQEAAEDTYVYQHMALDNFPLVAWKPLTEKEQAFFTKCQESHNPQIPYRQALVTHAYLYFLSYIYVDVIFFTHFISSTTSVEKGLNQLGALYVRCIILLFSGDDELKACGVKLMGGMKKSKYVRGKLKEHRDKLKSMLR
ncbi:UNVERIFIED_CONTAM: hypothetical protein Slati_3129100 [Sesamum latifolium]|uniref:At2g35280-like TPR domain-containing protein n=1 Tax=Sesamum latifolium TaxID=2727402 RepID=A0AAW2UVM8_9LAMI